MKGKHSGKKGNQLGGKELKIKKLKKKKKLCPFIVYLN